MLARPAQLRSTTLAALGCAIALCAGCKVSADVVAGPGPVEAGPGHGGGDASGKHDGGSPLVDGCDPSQRYKYTPPFLLELALVCEVQFSALTLQADAGVTQLSPDQFSQLISAPLLQSDAGVSGPTLCNKQVNGGWYLEPRNLPDRVVLCTTTCETLRRQVQFVIAQTGCDGSFDAGPFAGLAPGFGGGFAGGGGADAGRP